MTFSFSNQPKSDINPIGTADPTKYVSAADWQEVIAALQALIAGTAQVPMYDKVNTALSISADSTVFNDVSIDTPGQNTWQPIEVTNGGGTSVITGFAPSTGSWRAGQTITLYSTNVTSTNTVRIGNMELSSAANRIATPASADYSLEPGRALTLRYDEAGHWVFVSVSTVG